MEISEIRRGDVRRVVVLLAGSRTGSSFLFRRLSSAGSFLAPAGEETPLYRLAGMGKFSGPAYSDAITRIPSETELEKIGASLLGDCGLRSGHFRSGGEMAAEFLRRLDMQWPGLLSPARQEEWKEIFRLRHQREIPEASARKIYLDWVSELAGLGLPVSPALFSAQGDHPESLPLCEEPPYIFPVPRIRSVPECSRYPLLLKTSTNLYRIPFLKALFPRARFRWILLERNPAATISALMDGWLSSAFHSHDVSPHLKLRIGGYSDRVPGGERYWKFDMPPGWRELVSSPLAEVCAFQWLSAHKALSRFASSTEDPVFRIRYENFLQDEEGCLRHLLDFSGTAKRQDSPHCPEEETMTVSPPAPGKWKKRAAEIRSLLEGFQEGALLRGADHIGYDAEAWEEWP